MSDAADINPYQAPSSFGSAASQQPSHFRDQTDASVTPRVIEMLARTQPWVRFLSVLAFIAFGLLLVGALVGLAVGAGTGNVELAVLLVVYGVLGALYLGPAVFLGRYATNIARLRTSWRVEDLEAALEAQKSFWRFAGIVALILLVLYALIFVFGFAGMAVRMGRSPF